MSDPSKWNPSGAENLAFSTDIYKAETWQARIVKVAADMAFGRMLTGWNRRSGAASIPALGFYLFKMALGADAAALEPPLAMSDARVRSALERAQDRLETRFPYQASYGDLFRMTRERSLKSYPVGGGAATQAGMVTPRAIEFEQRGVVMMATGTGQAATQIVVLSNPPVSMTVLIPGESDQPDSPHLEDQLRELFSKEQAKPAYFADRKELERHLSSKKELIF
jgi:acyl-homoserine lactone acylase PvdQ